MCYELCVSCINVSYYCIISDGSYFPATTRDIAIQCLEDDTDCDFTEEDITIPRRPGEKLGFGLRFEGGGRASECVRRLYIQCCSPESPAARAACSWGGIVEGDQILEIGAQEIKKLTRLECVKALKGNPIKIQFYPVCIYEYQYQISYCSIK